MFWKVTIYSLNSWAVWFFFLFYGPLFHAPSPTLVEIFFGYKTKLAHFWHLGQPPNLWCILAIIRWHAYVESMWACSLAHRDTPHTQCTSWPMVISFAKKTLQTLFVQLLWLTVEKSLLVSFFCQKTHSFCPIVWLRVEILGVSFDTCHRSLFVVDLLCYSSLVLEH